MQHPVRKLLLGAYFHIGTDKRGLLARGPGVQPMFKYIPQPNSIGVIQVLQPT